MQNNHSGIDHPLVAVKDIDKACEDFSRLGFFINPRHHHPWGTDNYLLMFPENFIEVISVYDTSKLDLKNENGFAFGRFISDSIKHREGIALVALHSKNIHRDFEHIEKQNIENQGVVDFHRIAHKPDGSEEETMVSLLMLINSQYPSISHFFCHQHKPHLVWVDDWMEHPNGASGIISISYISKNPEDLLPRFLGIYGKDALVFESGHLKIKTNRGEFEIISPEQAQHRFLGIDIPIKTNQLPYGIAIRVGTRSMAQAQNYLQKQNVQFVKTVDGGLRIPANYAGNTIFEIYPE